MDDEVDAGDGDGVGNGDAVTKNQMCRVRQRYVYMYIEQLLCSLSRLSPAACSAISLRMRRGASTEKFSKLHSEDTKAAP